MNWTKGVFQVNGVKVNGLISKDRKLLLSPSWWLTHPIRIGSAISQCSCGYGKSIELSTAYLIDIQPMCHKKYTKGSIPSDLAERVLIASDKYEIAIPNWILDELKDSAAKGRGLERCPSI